MDSISDCSFVTEKSAIENLLKEGKPKERIHFVGNVMIDNLFHQLKRLDKEDPSQFPTHNLKKDVDDYVFLTLHRPSNVDSRETLMGITEAFRRRQPHLVCHA